MFNYDYDIILRCMIIADFYIHFKNAGRQLFKDMLKKYNDIFNTISLRLDDFKDCQLKIFKENDYDFYNGFRYISVAPLLEISNERELVLPHLLLKSFTQGLTNRFTYNNKLNRENLGHVVEKYIFYLCNISNQFNNGEVISEIKYNRCGKEAKSSDVILKSCNIMLFIESKLYVPQNRVRQVGLDVNDICNRVVDGIIQIYEKIVDYIAGLFKPFSDDFEEHNIIGLLVLYDDSFIFRDKIYERVKEKMNLESNSKTYKYICSNIKIVQLHSLEIALLSGRSIINELIEVRNNDNIKFDFINFASDGNDKYVKEFNNFLEKINKIYDEIERFLT